MKSASRKYGYSMLEIVIATFVFAIAIIPIYQALSGQSAREIETTKISLAKSILASVKNEILARPYDDISEMVVDGKLVGEPYPFALAKLIEAQKQHRDFELDISANFKLDGKALELKAEVTFTGLDKLQKKEEMVILHVQQDY